MSRFSYFFTAAVLLGMLLLAGCSLSVPHPSSLGPCGNPLLPTVQGATWHYDMQSSTTQDVFTRTILSSTSSGFTDQDIFHDSGLTRSGKWTCSSGSLTSLNAIGDLTASASRPSGPVPQLSFQTTDSSGVTLPALINTGDTWTQKTSLDGTAVVNLKNLDATSDVTMNCTAGGNEAVVVPAGRFNARRMDCAIEQQFTITIGDNPPAPATINYTTTYWYAPNVGMVKSVTSGNQIDTTITLASYTIP